MSILHDSELSCDGREFTRDRMLRVVGRSSRSEFAEVVAWLRSRAWRAEHWDEFPANDDLFDVDPPELMVVLQSWPDEFSGEQIDEWQEVWPLARLICVAGRWCESDGRSRSLWPLAYRASLELAIDRIQRELAFLHGDSRAMALPSTATRDELFVADYLPSLERTDESPQLLSGRAVQVQSADAALTEWIESVVALCGGSTTSDDGADLIIVDVDSVALPEAAQPEACRRMIAISGFPRCESNEAWRQVGATVLHKLAPWRVWRCAFRSAFDDTISG